MPLHPRTIGVIGVSIANLFLWMIITQSDKNKTRTRVYLVFYTVIWLSLSYGLAVFLTMWGTIGPLAVILSFFFWTCLMMTNYFFISLIIQTASNSKDPDPADSIEQINR